MKGDMLNEFTEHEKNRAVCHDCQCFWCDNPDCPIPCKAHIPCDSPVIKCKDGPKPGQGCKTEYVNAFTKYIRIDK